jgi:hypothetical protein
MFTKTLTTLSAALMGGVFAISAASACTTNTPCVVSDVSTRWPDLSI